MGGRTIPRIPSDPSGLDADPDRPPAAVVELQPTPSTLAEPTSFNEPLPTIGGLAPTPGAKHHAPDEQPPPKR